MVAEAVAAVVVALVAIQKIPRWEPLGGGREGVGSVPCAPTYHVSSVWGELVDLPSGDGPYHPARPCYFQELSLVRGVLGGL